MCIHQQNRHTLRDTVNHLSELGCGSLKTNPIADVGAWKEGGYGPAIDLEELYRIYLDYIPHYYEDGMPLSLMLGGFFRASPRRPKKWSIYLDKHCEDPEKLCVRPRPPGAVYFRREPGPSVYGPERAEDSGAIPFDYGDGAGEVHQRIHVYESDRDTGFPADHPQ